MLIHIENFYNNAKDIFEIVSKLDFKESLYGDEIPNFNMIPEGLTSAFSDLLGQKITLNKNSGVFRKPYSPVHFENFHENSLYVAIAALEDTKFTTYRHKELKSSLVFSVKENVNEFIKENCFDKEKWEVVADINLYQGNIVFVKPWIWHGLDNKLVKVFYIERHSDE